ncbi:hypothetical protein ACFVTE_03285 [Arthrobacter sp. NPDC058097]|uniref:hypothetical protein n=1 Tax=Arthrobacter sp. NPDC058097 TaxID=3346340 RepID=UPI0036DC1E99
MVEFFPILSKVSNLGLVRPGDLIEAREGDTFYCQERIDVVDVDRGIIWIRRHSGHLEPLSTEHFTFWRYVI